MNLFLHFLFFLCFFLDLCHLCHCCCAFISLCILFYFIVLYSLFAVHSNKIIYISHHWCFFFFFFKINDMKLIDSMKGIFSKKKKERAILLYGNMLCWHAVLLISYVQFKKMLSSPKGNIRWDDFSVCTYYYLYVCESRLHVWTRSLQFNETLEKLMIFSNDSYHLRTAELIEFQWNENMTWVLTAERVQNQHNNRTTCKWSIKWKSYALVAFVITSGQNLTVMKKNKNPPWVRNILINQ